MQRIFFLGHSLIEFFDWQARFPEHEVHNLGRAGETTEGLLSRTKEIIRSLAGPDFIFIMTGINDIAMEDFDFVLPLGAIIGLLKGAYPNSRIVLMNILPVRLEWIPEASLRRANEALRSLAEDTGIGHLDIHGAFVREGAGGCLLPDGVHLNEKGYALWSGLIGGMLGV